MATYLADRVVVYDGVPGVETYAHTPQGNTTTTTNTNTTNTCLLYTSPSPRD